MLVSVLLAGVAAGIAAQYVSRTRFPMGAVCIAALTLCIAWRALGVDAVTRFWVVLSTVGALAGSLWMNRHLRKRFPLSTTEE